MAIEKKLNIDYKQSSFLFERAMKKFQLKKIIYRSLFRGKGLEFDGYRSFAPEDDYNSIDWKATLRAGGKMVRQYKEERDVNVYFLVDCDRGMLFGSGNKLKAEHVGEIVCVLANLILNSGDKAGLIMYSDSEVRVLNPSNNKNQLLLMHKFLSDIENYKGNFDICKALEFCFKFTRGRSSNLVLLSDFLNIKKGFENNLSLVSHKTDFVSIMVRDKMDEDLPKERYKIVFQDPISNRRMTIDSQVARGKFREQVLKQKQKLKKIFRDGGIDLLELRNSEEFVLVLSEFMKKRVGERRV